MNHLFFRKSVFIALFVAMMSVLSVTAVQAQVTPTPCYPGMMDVMKNQSEAKRVEDKAYAMAIIKRNDPSLGMTCFDKAMGVTARLGSIFSDVFSGPTLTSIVNTTVFSGGAGDTAASLMKMFTAGPGNTGSLLIHALNNTVTPTLNQYLGNFTGTLSAILGTTVGNFLNTIVGAIDGALAQINTAVMGVVGQINTVLTTLTQIQNFANQLGVALPQAVILAVTAFLRTLQSTLTSIMAAVAAAISTFMSTIMDFVMNTLLPSLTNMTCDRIANLWDDGNATTGAVSVEGSGIEAATPYFDYASLVSQGAALAGISADMVDELNNPFNVTVLANANTDLTTRLNVACAIKTWKTAQTIAAGTSLTAVIALINQPDPCP